ncbi:MAG: hypothetical protein HY063_05515 [Bacteroidetes bacterium]|nr:hypothetical protein [Bacteroidota bacterium]
MKKIYTSFVLLFPLLLLSGCTSTNSIGYYEYDDDLYNTGRTYHLRNENDSLAQDSAYPYSPPYRAQYHIFYHWNYSPYYSCCSPFGCYHGWWWHCWHSPYYYDGPYYGHHWNNMYYGHRREFALHRKRMDTPHSKPFSARGGFGSTGRGHSFSSAS